MKFVLLCAAYRSHSGAGKPQAHYHSSLVDLTSSLESPPSSRIACNGGVVVTP
ncbi:MAG: hypothetical protein HZA90_16590 [Verrucomicrobia bacterium]|nr:hypothetical protein [Verrucomicrobiota bacterium]